MTISVAGLVVDGDAVAEREFRRLLAEEGAEQAGFRPRRLAPLGVVHHVDQARQAEHVGEQDELLPEGRAGLAHGGEEGDAGQPLLRRQLHLPREVVQVAHRGRHHLAQPRVRRFRHLREDLPGHAEAVEILHGRPLPWPALRDRP